MRNARRVYDDPFCASVTSVRAMRGIRSHDTTTASRSSGSSIDTITRCLDFAASSVKQTESVSDMIGCGGGRCWASQRAGGYCVAIAGLWSARIARQLSVWGATRPAVRIRLCSITATSPSSVSMTAYPAGTDFDIPHVRKRIRSMSGLTVAQANGAV